MGSARSDAEGDPRHRGIQHDLAGGVTSTIGRAYASYAYLTGLSVTEVFAFVRQQRRDVD